jgi:ferredoxin
MTYVITSACVGTCAGACLDVCPVDCISGPVSATELKAVPLGERGKRFPSLQLFIDPDLCIDCNSCADECPVGAIFSDDSVPAKYVADIAANAAFFQRR